MNAARALGRLLSREPVALGAALVAWIAVASPSEAVMAAATASVGVVVRWLSVPTQKAAENEAAAKDQGANEAVVLMAEKKAAPAKPPARKATK